MKKAPRGGCLCQFVYWQRSWNFFHAERSIASRVPTLNEQSSAIMSWVNLLWTLNSSKHSSKQVSYRDSWCRTDIIKYRWENRVMRLDILRKNQNGLENSWKCQVLKLLSVCIPFERFGDRTRLKVNCSYIHYTHKKTPYRGFVWHFLKWFIWLFWTRQRTGCPDFRHTMWNPFEKFHTLRWNNQSQRSVLISWWVCPIRMNSMWCHRVGWSLQCGCRVIWHLCNPLNQPRLRC